MKVRIDFADGWSHDRVVVSVGGREQCRLDGVTTRPATNLAGSLDLDVPDAAASRGIEVEIEVPGRDLHGRHRLQGDETLLVVNVTEDGLAFVTPAGPYGYG